MRPKKALTKFLRASLQTRMRLTEWQIRLLEPDITKEQIMERIEEADWCIVEEKVENGITVYSLIDRVFVCICVKEPIHWHNDEMACCGGSDCCPEAVYVDYETQIVHKVAYI